MAAVSGDPTPTDPTVIARKLRPVFEAHPEIVCAYLFGSRARGTARPASDVDISVWRAPGCIEPEEPWRTCWGDLHHELATALGEPPDRVDLVLLDRVSDPLLRHRATWMGRRLFCRDDAARVALETAVLVAFMDTQHLRAIQHEALKRALKARRGR